MVAIEPGRTVADALSASQLADYERDGFVVLRGAFDEAELSRVDAAVARHPAEDGTLETGFTYPEPGRYTLANNCLKDPDFGFMAEHPTILRAATQALGDDPRLTAFVLYNRTPGGPGIPSHNDYKRWRPVGSSMHWLFTIVPLCDFDAAAGQLFVAPGSHRLDRVHEGAERPLEITAAIRPPEADYIDPELERGDLLLMNMHTWHRAAGNDASHDRTGLFNKYAAASAPPATGYLVYDKDVHATLSPANRDILAVHSDLAVETTRAILTRAGRDGTEVLATRDDRGRLGLPGGPTWVEQAIPDWDHGNYIAALQSHLREHLRVETPWLSYAGDFVDSSEGAGSTAGEHLCRTYGYDLPGHGFPVPYRGAEWVGVDELGDRAQTIGGWEADAVAAWLDPAPTRGKGLTQAQSRINQYAY